MFHSLIVFGIESSQEPLEVYERHEFFVLVLVFGPEIVDVGGRYLDAESGDEPHELVLRQHAISRSVDFCEKDTDF